jgi:hypothetical protein
LNVSLGELTGIADNAKSHYKPFPLQPKKNLFSRKPPKPPRPIDRPTGRLLEVQRSINDILLGSILLPEHINGAVPKRTIYLNAEMHRGAPVLVTIDIKQCFPSITSKHIYQVWCKTLGCSPEIGAVLTKLTTFERRLPQGAPTSPALANLFIWSIDEPVRALCMELGLSYSTWLDDLAFSGARAREAIQQVIQCLAASGLAVSHQKTKLMGGHAIKKLTGTRLGGAALRFPKPYLSNVRAGIWTLSQGKVPASMELRNAAQLLGRLRHVRRVCAADFTPLLKHLRRHVATFPAAVRPSFEEFLVALD